jgi:hypothetical protein
LGIGLVDLFRVVGVLCGETSTFEPLPRCGACGCFNPSGVGFRFPWEPGVRFATPGCPLQSLRDRENKPKELHRNRSRSRSRAGPSRPCLVEEGGSWGVRRVRAPGLQQGSWIWHLETALSLASQGTGDWQLGTIHIAGLRWDRGRRRGGRGRIRRRRRWRS